MQLEKLLHAVDLRPDVERVDDQLEAGSCQSHACASALEIAFKRAGNPVDLSRMYLYYYFQKQAGTLGTLGGGNPGQIANILNEVGCCKEQTWPYIISQAGHEPKASAIAEAKSIFPAGSVAVVGLGTSQIAIKRALNKGSPVVFLVNNNHSFWNDGNTKDWRKTAWDENDTFTMQHVVVCIGYDDAAGRFLCQNSSGPNWGDGGFFGVPYSYTKYLAGATSFSKLPVELKPLSGYVPYGEPAFDSATGMLEMPQCLAIKTAFGGLSVHKNVIAKIHDGGTILKDSPKMIRSDCAYVRFETFEGEKHLGFKRLILDGQLYENILCVNPRIELISAEAE